MAELDDIAFSLAEDVIAAMEETGDDRLFDQASKLVADSSSTLHEAFITAVRVLRAERRARELVAQARKSHDAKKTGEAKAPAAHHPAPHHPAGAHGHGHAAAGHAHSGAHSGSRAGAKPPSGGTAR